MRAGLPLCLTALALLGCNSPRPAEPEKGKRVLPVTRGNPPPAAAESPPPEPVTRPAPGDADAECVLTFGATDLVFDCSFPQCPRDLIAHLLTADSVALDRAGEVWLLESSRKDPPFSPVGKTVLNVYAEHAEIHVPGLPTASCPLPSAVKERLAAASTIGVTNIQVRRSLMPAMAR